LNAIVFKGVRIGKGAVHLAEALLFSQPCGASQGGMGKPFSARKAGLKSLL
jgi:hypothetical protein